VTVTHGPGLSRDARSDAEQAAVLGALAQWLAAGAPGQYRTVGGYAGTGKSFVISRITSALPDLRETDVMFCCPTGKACRVLQDKLAAQGVNAEVNTLHSLLYSPVERHVCGCWACPTETGSVKLDSCPQPQLNSRGVPVTSVAFASRGEVELPRLIVVDEASMVDERTWLDLLALGVPVIAVGDHGQLLPVKSSFSLMRDPHLRLEVIRRQELGDPVTVMAAWAREQGYVPPGVYGPLARKVSPAEANGPWAAAAQWEPGTLMVVATNRARRYWNASIRNWYLPGETRPCVKGDQVVCLKNDKELGIRNGEIFTVAETRDHGDVIVMVTSDGQVLNAAIAQFGSDDRLERSETPDGAGLFDYAFALTAHKCQGSEADRVIVVEEQWPFGPERARWLYTACTRAKRELTVVGT
jgi:exodeoxyribonuclease V